ncbi:MAG: M48 family metallopeptidase [Clostridia bacterium]|nr:M48 family metallopeptidase [Clostridia bacterium]
MTVTGNIQTRTLIVEGETIPYELERKQIKRLNLRVRRDGTVHVSAPVRMSMAFIEAFLAEKGQWVKEAQKRVLARRPAVTELCTGVVIPIAGIPHTLIVGKGRQGVLLENDRLFLTVRDPADAAECARVFRRFVKTAAAEALTERVKAIYPYFAPRPATLPTLSFRWMRSRWGSCTAAKNHITLNEKLLFVEPHLADYVIFHEFCHFKHQDHSAAFYKHLSAFVPDYAAARRALAASPIPNLK